MKVDKRKRGCPWRKTTLHWNTAKRLLIVSSTSSTSRMRTIKSRFRSSRIIRFERRISSICGIGAIIPISWIAPKPHFSTWQVRPHPNSLSSRCKRRQISNSGASWRRTRSRKEIWAKTIWFSRKRCWINPWRRKPLAWWRPSLTKDLRPSFLRNTREIRFSRSKNSFLERSKCTRRKCSCRCKSRKTKKAASPTKSA